MSQDIYNRLAGVNMTDLKVVKKENSMAGDIQSDETNVVDGG